MLLSLVVLYTVTELFVAAESIQETSVNILEEKRIKPNQGALSFYASINNNLPPVNRTYYEKDVNPLRVPDKFYEQRKKKSKVTKSPKRTIQKIIKNGKNRSRKIYVHPVTRQPTKPSEDVDIPFINTEKNVDNRQNNRPTEHIHKKKPKKTSRVARYPMPFHNFQTRMNVHKRNRRDVDRNDLYIFKDLDEIEFLSKEKDYEQKKILSKEKDYDIVRAHVQNYW